MSPFNFISLGGGLALFLFGMSILAGGMEKASGGKVENLWQALWIFNAPFTFVKGLFSVAITFLIYKRISPIIKGK